MLVNHKIENNRTTIREIRTTNNVVLLNDAGNRPVIVTGRPASGDVHVSKKLASGSECTQERAQEQTSVAAVKASLTGHLTSEDSACAGRPTSGDVRLQDLSHLDSPTSWHMCMNHEVENNRTTAREIRSTCDRVVNKADNLCTGDTDHSKITSDQQLDIDLLHDYFAGPGSPPPSWMPVDLAADETNTSNSLNEDEASFPSESPSQCSTGVTSSFPISEIDVFSIPFSASVEEGLGAGVVVVGRSTGALAQVEKILLGLWKSSAFAVS